MALGSGGFGVLYGVDNVQDFVEAGDSEHALDALVHVGEGETGAVVAAVDLMTDDLAHAGRIDVRDGREVENGVTGELAGAKCVANDVRATEGDGANDAQDGDVG